jgi:hypothetical protein
MIASKKKLGATEGLSRQEFLIVKSKIEAEPFRSREINPLAIGAERSKFEKQKLLRLIALGMQVEGTTVKTQVERWRRKLTKLEKTEARFRTLQSEMHVRQISPWPSVMAVLRQ